MTIFVILPETASMALDAEIRRQFGVDSYNIASNQWLVSQSQKTTTTKEILDALGASAGQFGRIAIFSISGYFGYHKTDMWEWIKTRVD